MAATVSVTGQPQVWGVISGVKGTPESRYIKSKIITPDVLAVTKRVMHGEGTLLHVLDKHLYEQKSNKEKH